ncbi:MAG: VWA domain-containing protein [Deltaproteobacteria bacterium]|nr:VWA domain-containing protein [Deltaproteobacteria bacterium]
MSKTVPACALLACLALACEGTSGGRRARDAGPDGAAQDTGTVDTETYNDDCDEVGFPVSGRPPDVMILLDRSASLGVGDPRPWDPTSAAVTAIAEAMDPQIRFGLTLFPPGQGVCAAASGPNVPVGEGTSQHIADILSKTEPTGRGTPTTVSLDAVAAYLAALDDESPKVILLATDGAPNCSDSPALDCETCIHSWSSCESARDCLDVTTIAHAMDIHDFYGIDIYVIGMGGVVADFDDVMSQIAQYGGTGDFYPAATPDALEAAFKDVAAATVECTFSVDWSALAPGTSKDKGKVNVFADGVLAPFSAACANKDGWRWLDDGTVELCGDLCHDYRYAIVHHVTATFGCDTVVE